MCSRTTCPNCKKPTWTGCGKHIEEALAGVPESERCQCQVASYKSKGLFARLMGR